MGHESGFFAWIREREGSGCVILDGEVVIESDGRAEGAGGSIVIAGGGGVMTQASSKHLHVEIFQEATVAMFTDAFLIDDIVIESVGKELFGLIERQGQRRLVLNFSEVQFLSSALLVKLFRLRDMVGKSGGILKLCDISPDLLRLFKLYPKHSFEIFNNEQDALDSF